MEDLYGKFTYNTLKMEAMNEFFLLLINLFFLLLPFSGRVLSDVHRISISPVLDSDIEDR